jgi:hypothetical protein
MPPSRTFFITTNGKSVVVERNTSKKIRLFRKKKKTFRRIRDFGAHI